MFDCGSGGQKSQYIAGQKETFVRCDAVFQKSFTFFHMYQLPDKNALFLLVVLLVLNKTNRHST